MWVAVVDAAVMTFVGVAWPGNNVNLFLGKLKHRIVSSGSIRILTHHLFLKGASKIKVFYLILREFEILNNYKLKSLGIPVMHLELFSGAGLVASLLVLT